MGGGSTEQKTEIPKWLERSARDNIAQGQDVAGLGYVPYFGPDVAEFTPMQQASFQNTGQAANAFGMAGGGMTGMEGMPQPQQFAGGVSGYSSAPMFAETMAALEANNPGQFAAIQNMFINPQTGAGGNQAQMQSQPAPQYGSGGGRDYAPRMSPSGGGGSRYQGPNQNGDVGYGSSGYSSIRDMIDGGGAGSSGGSFSGGGFLSSAANRLTGR
jgi:hypothetical protein